MITSEFSQLRINAGLTIKQTATVLGYNQREIYRYEKGSILPRNHIINYLKTLNINSKNDSNSDFTFIDLFAGIGGLRIAFESIHGKCIYTSELDRFANQTYISNFQDNHQISGDITKINESEIPNHDVLLAGFPCQPFSIAGVSKKISLGQSHGFASETQGTLFFDIVRIINAKRPKAFLLENVKNLKSHDKGNTFKIIMNILEDELGYRVHYKVIDAQHFLPQHRERIVIVGFRDNVDFSWDDLILPSKGEHKLESVLYSNDKTSLEKYTLSDKLWNYLQNYAIKHREKGNGFGYSLVSGNDIAKTLSARYFKDGSEILICQGNKKNPRRLTPRECARLMGYGENFLIPVSDTQAYKQFGNSVAIPVFKEVARIMQPHIYALTKSLLEYQKPFPIIS